ncbi:hypothetical protein [Arachidicoccus terrestris]|uniref:hypothetical protein n=1 Tax=Arachidicoccus terrestris TaxID=2875539 RepID=UPI001CC71A60|nr:hypothetical protein [Arachidicoccus terrestris]UAY56250.1 hypothetical protein K9M52_04320 [Arachidicoccus terrestris]
MKNLKIGDQVIMEGCAESTLPKYKNRIWTCQTDSYIDKCGQEVVFLDGFSGCFLCDYLKPVAQIDAIGLISSERAKQISKGYTPEHDAGYTDETGCRFDSIAFKLLKGWPAPPAFNTQYWQNLISLPYQDQLRIAGAWIAAELDRVLFLNQSEGATSKVD